MKKYNPQSNKYGNGHGPNNRTPQKRGWTSPSHLTPYEKSVWLQNSFNGRVVKMRPHESVDNLLRRFRKKVEQSGVMKELKQRSFYTPPGQQKREKHLKELKRRRKLERKMRAEGNIDYESKPSAQEFRTEAFGRD